MLRPIMIYNLFPRLAGYIENWHIHAQRAKDMGFNVVYVNPIQFPGFSGSLYSVKDYYRYNPQFFRSKSVADQEKEIRAFTEFCHQAGLQVLMDLVINHTAVDCVLIQSNPQWYLYDKKGNIVHPGAYQKGVKIVEWGDLAEIDNQHSKDKTGLWEYWKKLVRHMVGMGFDGFRCDAAYQVPAELWKELIDEARRINPGALFLAETLGCTTAQTGRTAKAGFDYIFNSSKYWDFKAPWCLKQYSTFRKISSSVSFPESHDTTRLYKDVDGNSAEVKKRYLFSALFSGGVMIPTGFEYGFKNKLDVVTTTPFNWEPVNFDFSGFIAQVNAVKSSCTIFHTDSAIKEIRNDDPRVFVMQKSDHGVKALVAINKDAKDHARFFQEDLYKLLNADKVEDISPDWGGEPVPRKYEYWLRPSQAKVFVTC
ncbi:MAG: alpha-amylase family glycosyl hydrolase [Candidatus Wallbacteria bacterium]|nr:alpha-amylase family glycosyl hydrolase [Candidatus Wallbacteria bacterium]